jgi:hypothetical protein
VLLGNELTLPKLTGTRMVFCRSVGIILFF